MNANRPEDLPSYVRSVVGELDPNYWKPQSMHEWAEMAQTAAYLKTWIQQQDQERSLRKVIAIWVFILISLQVAGVFTLVVLDACGVLKLNQAIVQILIPSVLGEVFGMGFVVVKYLFRPLNLSPVGGAKNG
jgi:hypothetical protein